LSARERICLWHEKTVCPVIPMRLDDQDGAGPSDNEFDRINSPKASKTKVIGNPDTDLGSWFKKITERG